MALVASLDGAGWPWKVGYESNRFNIHISALTVQVSLELPLGVVFLVLLALAFWRSWRGYWSRVESLAQEVDERAVGEEPEQEPKQEFQECTGGASDTGEPRGDSDCITMHKRDVLRFAFERVTVKLSKH